MEIIISVILVTAIGLLWVCHWYGALFMQAFFNHRYMTHRQCEMSQEWEQVFYVLSFLVQGAGYLSMRAYVLLHRMHHAHSDEKQDPHSPRYFFTMLGLIWNMGKRHTFLKKFGLDLPQEQQDTIIKNLDKKTRDWYEAGPINPAIFNNLPKPSKLDTFFDSKLCRIGWMITWSLPYIAGSFVVAQFNLWYGLYIFLWTLFPFHLLMIPIQGTLVNWFGHSRGSRNFNNNDDSTNAYFLRWILWGEENQNNHHHAPARPNFAFKTTEHDVIYRLMLKLRELGIIQLKPVENNM